MQNIFREIKLRDYNDTDLTNIAKKNKKEISQLVKSELDTKYESDYKMTLFDLDMDNENIYLLSELESLEYFEDTEPDLENGGLELFRIHEKKEIDLVIKIDDIEKYLFDDGYSKNFTPILERDETEIVDTIVHFVLESVQ